MNEKKPNRLLQRIFEIRRSKKISLDKLAKSLRVKAPESASQIENGKNPLNANYLDDVAALLGVKTWEFFIDEEAEDIGPLSHDEVMLVLDFREVAKEKDGKRSNALLESAKALAKRT